MIALAYSSSLLPTTELLFGVPAMYYLPLSVIGIGSALFFYGKTGSVEKGAQYGAIMFVIALFSLILALYLGR